MSVAEKAELVAGVRATYGLNTTLAAVGLAKSSWYYHQQKISYGEKYAHLRPLLEEIVTRHPAYGSPRITQELQKVYQQRVNHKVVERLLGEWDLTEPKRQAGRVPSPIRQVVVAAKGRANLVAQLSEIGLFKVAYTDFTELIYANGQRKAYLMPILAHRCKLVYGWAVGERANTVLALAAWQRAKQSCHQYGIAYQGMIIHHDQDPVYTGYGWTEQVLVVDQARLSYALRGAKDNPVMESFNGRFKTEGGSLFLQAATLVELQAVVATQMAYHNTQRRHSSLGYRSPLAYLENIGAGE